MAQHTIGAYAGNVTGYVSHGPDVRADAGQPGSGGGAGGPQFRAPFTPPDAIATPAQGSQHERPELPEDESPQESSRDPWTYRLRVDEPSFAGAIQGRGGPLADQISGPGRAAIESGAGQVIAGIAEDVL